jgi:hypothetical protein
MNNNDDNNGNYSNITIKKDNHLDDISEEDSKDDKYIKVDKNNKNNNKNTNNNDKRQNNNKHKPKDDQNNKNVSKYQQQQQLQHQNKPNEHQPVMLSNSVHNINNTKQDDAKEIDTRTPLVPHSILSPVADKTQIKHISINNNNNNQNNNNNTHQILLTNQNTTTNLHYQPKPIPKIPQPNISNDHSVSLPICFPSPNPFKWQRHYFIIGDPIDAADYTGLQNDELAQRHLRDRVKAELERGLANGQQYQEQDEDRYTLHRWGKAIKGLFGY